LAEQWNGSAWSVLPVPNPRAENGSALTAVDCLAPTSCEAEGNYDYADVDQSVFASSWDGTQWTSQKQVNPGGQSFNADNSLSCTSSQACTSVGIWTNIGSRGLAERWDGTGWHRETVPAPVKAQLSDLNGVSCPQADECIAVGDSADNLNDYPDVTMAEVWDGTAWRISPTPTPTGFVGNSLSGVSCWSFSNCVAVGGSENTSSGATLVERYRGT
jgi:hypothetical protein